MLTLCTRFVVIVRSHKFKRKAICRQSFVAVHRRLRRVTQETRIILCGPISQPKSCRKLRPVPADLVEDAYARHSLSCLVKASFFSFHKSSTKSILRRKNHLAESVETPRNHLEHWPQRTPAAAAAAAKFGFSDQGDQETLHGYKAVSPKSDYSITDRCPYSVNVQTIRHHWFVFVVLVDLIIVEGGWSVDVFGLVQDRWIFCNFLAQNIMRSLYRMLHNTPSRIVF